MKEQLSDGFIWEIINYEEAPALFLRGEEIYKLYDDESEGLVESLDDLHDAINKGINLGIEVGFTNAN